MFFSVLRLAEKLPQISLQNNPSHPKATTFLAVPIHPATSSSHKLTEEIKFCNQLPPTLSKKNFQSVILPNEIILKINIYHNNDINIILLTLSIA
jgi:hypothetical protein